MAFAEIARRWIDGLDDYERATLAWKNAPASWSVGQVYAHLLETTDLITSLAIRESLGDCSLNAGKSPNIWGLGILMFGFPPFRFPVPTIVSKQPPQPEGVEWLRREMRRVANDVHELHARADDSTCSGRYPHPRLGYLSAQQWLHFIELHWTHHLRQKRRIDAARESHRRAATSA
jgi:hypothetical protein